MAAGDIKTIHAEDDFRGAVVFDGTDDYVAIDAWGVEREAAGTADTVGTLAGWISINSGAATYCLICAGDDDADEFLYLGVVNGLVHAELSDAATTDWDIESDAIHVTTDGWHHIAVVQDGTQPVLYHNGVAVAATNDVSVDLTAWFSQLNGIDRAAIGILDANTSLTLDMDGAISGVKHWNRVLSAEEIMAEYQGESVNTVDLISSWALDGDVVDSVSAHNGTNTGHAYNSDWSQVSKELHLGYTHAGDNYTTFKDGNKYTIFNVTGA